MFLAAAAAVGQFAQETGTGIFYKVSGGKNEMYLLGSIHVGNREMYPFSSAVRNALQKADALVFECDTASAEAQAVSAQLMRSEHPLSDAVSAECYELVQKAAAKLGYDPSALEGMKPWAVTNMMTVAAAADGMDAAGSRAASALGVENMVRRQAGKKNVLYLETAAQQLQLIDGFSQALQEYLLSSACEAVIDPENAKGTDQDIEQWPAWWKDGNAQAFADSYTRGLNVETPPELAREYHQTLMTQRNLHMAKTLSALLESDEPNCCLVTVGLMHLVLEEDSILTLLQEMGYSVEKISG